MGNRTMAKSTSTPLPRSIGAVLWGISIALSWMWGLGLFFSVQFTTQFGLFGLLTFAVPNFLGLLIFGLVTHHLARRQSGSESLAQFFANWSRPFRLVFFLYQILAITLTIFAFIRYFWQPLGFEPWLLFMPLVMLSFSRRRSSSVRSLTLRGSSLAMPCFFSSSCHRSSTSCLFLLRRESAPFPSPSCQPTIGTTGDMPCPS